MVRVLNILRLSSFVIMTITSIPLVIAYLADRSPQLELIVHFHVIFGLLFIITAVPLMIMKREQEKHRNDAN